MEETDTEGKIDEIITLESEEANKPEDDTSNHPQIMIQNLNALKDHVNLHKHQYMGFSHTKFSLMLLAKYARERVATTFLKNKKKNWTQEEAYEFGEYVISILALTDKTHFTLNHMHSNYYHKALVEDIKKSDAKNFLCNFYDATKITDLVWAYFKSGFSKKKANTR